MPAVSSDATSAEDIEKLCGGSPFPFLDDIRTERRFFTDKAFPDAICWGTLNGCTVFALLCLPRKGPEIQYWYKPSVAEAYEPILRTKAIERVDINAPFNYLIKNDLEGRQGSEHKSNVQASFLKACFLLKGLTQGQPIDMPNTPRHQVQSALKILQVKLYELNRGRAMEENESPPFVGPSQQCHAEQGFAHGDDSNSARLSFEDVAHSFGSGNRAGTRLPSSATSHANDDNDSTGNLYRNPLADRARRVRSSTGSPITQQRRDVLEAYIKEDQLSAGRHTKRLRVDSDREESQKAIETHKRLMLEYDRTIEDIDREDEAGRLNKRVIIDSLTITEAIELGKMIARTS